MDAAIFLSLLFVAAAAAGLSLASSARWAFAKPEKWLIVAILILTLVPSGVGDSLEGSLFRQVTWGSLFVFCFFIVLASGTRRQGPPLSQIVPIPLAILVCYVVVSTVWSEHPGVSLRRASQIVGVFVIAMAFARLSVQGGDLHKRLLTPLVVFVCL
jgi:hypothetical protein